MNSPPSTTELSTKRNISDENKKINEKGGYSLVIKKKVSAFQSNDNLFIIS